LEFANHSDVDKPGIISLLLAVNS